MDPLRDGISQLELEDYMGNDDSPVRAARASFGKANKTGENPQADLRLTRYLAKHGHLTPFEHTSLKFFVKAPIFVVRQWHRHRIGWSYNEISRRYTEEQIEFHIPNKLRKQAKDNKQASLVYDWNDYNTEIRARSAIQDIANSALYAYHWMLEQNVAREQARMVLPQNLYTSMVVTCNLRSLAHFIGLRDHDGAQHEIREYAKGMKMLAAEIFPNSMEALLYHD